jgi:Ca2+-binding EF-hand superfamily protein
MKGKELTSGGRLSRFAEKEISRIETSEGFSLFMNGEKEKLTDTDFYNFLGVTPRTPKNDFLGRLETVGSAIQELKNQKNVSFPRDQITAYHEFVASRFEGIISHFKSK